MRFFGLVFFGDRLGVALRPLLSSVLCTVLLASIDSDSGFVKIWRAELRSFENMNVDGCSALIGTGRYP